METSVAVMGALSPKALINKSTVHACPGIFIRKSNLGAMERDPVLSPTSPVTLEDELDIVAARLQMALRHDKRAKGDVDVKQEPHSHDETDAETASDDEKGGAKTPPPQRWGV